jgi:hypothetical protein
MRKNSLVEINGNKGFTCLIAPVVILVLGIHARHGSLTSSGDIICSKV